MEKSERDLLDLARRGDSRAIDELLARHEKQVFRFGLRMCGSEDDAREVLQETLLAAFKNLPEFRGEAALSTWLYQIARSFCSKSRRRGVGEPERHEELAAAEVQSLAAPDDAPDQRAHARQIGEALQAAISALPEQWREVVVLRDVEGLPAEEAARILGLEVPALKSRLHRARNALREAVGALLGAGADGDRPGSPCPELAEELADYAAADIDQATCARIEAHLASCERCKAACSTLQRTVSLCRQIPGDRVPEAVRKAVRQALLSGSAQPAAAR